MAQPYQAYPYRGPKEPSALERLQSWWNSFGGQPLPPADTSTRTDWQNIPELTQPEAPLKGLLHPAAQLALDVAPVTGEYRAAQRVQPLLGEGGRMIREGDLLGGSGKMAEGTAEYLSTLPLVGLGVRPLVGLAKAGAEAAPPFFSRVAKGFSESKRGKGTGREWRKDTIKEEERLKDPSKERTFTRITPGVRAVNIWKKTFKNIEDAESYLKLWEGNPGLINRETGDVLKREDLIETQLVPNPKFGAKIEELEATGVKGLLEANLEKVFTRKELQDWADANAIQVEEVMYGQTVPEFKLVEEGLKSGKGYSVGEKRYGRRTAHTVVDPISGDSVLEYDKIEDAQAEVDRLNQVRLEVDRPASISPNTFATREEAEKALARETKSHYGYAVRDHSGRTVSYHNTRESAQQDAKLIDGGLVINLGAPKKVDYKIIEGERKVPTHLEGRNLQLEGAREYRELVLKFPDTDPPIFPHVGAHHPVDNPILHLRFNERTGPEGERMLFIEELQSDWGQRGQHLGWSEPGAKTKIDELKREIEARQADLEAFGTRMFPGDDPADIYLRGLREEVVEQIRTKSPKELETEFGLSPEDVDSLLEIPGDIHRLRDRVGELENMRGPTKAPIVSKTDTWTDLGLRRMLRYAVDNGYSSIGVSTGATQAGVEGAYKGYWGHVLDADRRRGLRKYYDEIIPNRLNKIAKSLGGKVKVQMKDTDILVPADEFGDRAGEWEPSFDLDTPPFEVDLQPDLEVVPGALVHRSGLAPGEGPEVEVFRVRNHPDAEEGVAKAIIVERVGGRDEYPDDMISDYIQQEWDSGDWAVIQLKEDPDLFGDEIAEGLGEKYAVIDPNGEIFNPHQGGVDYWGYDSRDLAMEDLSHQFESDAEMMMQDELAERLGLEMGGQGEIHLYEAPDHFLADHPDFEVLDSNGNPVGPGEPVYINEIIGDYINNTSPAATFYQSDITDSAVREFGGDDLYAVHKYLRKLKGKTEADKVKIRTLEITDKMKESILKGMPLLAGAGITAGLLSEQQRQQAPQSLIY